MMMIIIMISSSSSSSSSRHLYVWCVTQHVTCDACQTTQGDACARLSSHGVILTYRTQQHRNMTPYKFCTVSWQAVPYAFYSCGITPNHIAASCSTSQHYASWHGKTLHMNTQHYMLVNDTVVANYILTYYHNYILDILHDYIRASRSRFQLWAYGGGVSRRRPCMHACMYVCMYVCM